MGFFATGGGGWQWLVAGVGGRDSSLPSLVAGCWGWLLSTGCGFFFFWLVVLICRMWFFLVLAGRWK